MFPSLELRGEVPRVLKWGGHAGDCRWHEPGDLALLPLSSLVVSWPSWLPLLVDFYLPTV